MNKGLILFAICHLLFALGCGVKEPRPHRDPRLSQVGMPIKAVFRVTPPHGGLRISEPFLPKYSIILQASSDENPLVNEDPDLYFSRNGDYGDTFPSELGVSSVMNGSFLVDLGEGRCIEKKISKKVDESPEEWVIRVFFDAYKNRNDNGLKANFGHCYYLRVDQNVFHTFDALFYFKQHETLLKGAKDYIPFSSITKEIVQNDIKEERVYLEEIELLSLYRNFEYWRRVDNWPYDLK